METLKEHINRKHGGFQVDFAKEKGVSKQQVHEWLKHGGYYIHDNKLFLLRRDFNFNQ